MKKILIVCLISVLTVLNLVGCKSKDSSNSLEKKDITEENSKKENKNNRDDDQNDESNSEDKKDNNIIDYLTDSSFDATAYVKSCLDLLTKGETKDYMKMTKRTKEQAEEDYQNNLNIMVESMGINNLSIQLQEDYAEFFKELYKKSKYNVKSSEKMNNRDGYTVTIEIEQITGLFDGLEEELLEKTQEFITDETSVEAASEIVFQAMLDLMNERLDKITYAAPKTVIVDVIADNKNTYSITNQGYADINEALISTNGL